MEYMPQVRISKEDFLALSDLAGEMSVMDYMSKIIHEHVVAQQSAQTDVCITCDKCGKYHSVYIQCQAPAANALE